jgi:hypothetical protein
LKIAVSQNIHLFGGRSNDAAPIDSMVKIHSSTFLHTFDIFDSESTIFQSEEMYRQQYDANSDDETDGIDVPRKL